MPKAPKYNLKIISFVTFLLLIITLLSLFLITQVGEKVADDGDYFYNLITDGNSLAEKNKQENVDLFINNINNVPGEIPPISEADHLKGELNAPVEIIIYDDFAAPFSSDFASVVDRAIEEYEGQLAVAFRHFPSETDALSLLSALAAECVGEQGKFWEMHDRLYEANTNKELVAAEFNLYAESLGLDVEDFTNCFESAKYRDKILNQADIAEQALVTGTPTFFVNGKIYIGAYPYEDFTRSDGSEDKGLRSIIEGELVE